MGAPELEVIEIRPQPGPQEAFLACDADIAIVGGGAFGGKSFSLILEDLRHIENPDFRSVTFRRTSNQLRGPKSLWEEACKLYPIFGARMVDGPMECRFPSGAISKFSHLEHEKDVRAWDSSQIPLIKFDQLESFEESQFWYMLSRNRDPSGRVKPYIRAACNPEPDSWLKRLLQWWIDPKTGYAIPERSGVVRWFVRFGDDLQWAETREELLEQFGHKDLPVDHPKQPRPMSLTFIVARMWDNKIGVENDPDYVAKLMAMPRYQRERLLGDEDLGGNWNVRATAGMLFQRAWCTPLEAEPADVDWVRGWDLAATRPNAANSDPDWTVGVKLGRYRSDRKRYVIAGAIRMRESPAKVETALQNTALADGPKTKVRLKQDPGQAGKSQAQSLVGKLVGFSVKVTPESGDKVTKFSPFSAQAEAGNVDYVLGAVPEEYLRALESFPDAKHDDDVDATSTAFEEWATPGAGANLMEHYRREKAERDRQVEEAKAKKAQILTKDETPERAERAALRAQERARQDEQEAIDDAVSAAMTRVAEELAKTPQRKPTSSFVEAMAAKLVEESR